MSALNASGMIIIRENTPLPQGLALECEAFLPGWNTVRNLDGYALARKIEEANWNLFYLAGEISAIALGRQGPATLRRAIKRVLAKRVGQKFNSLQISNVVYKWFLGIPFVRVVTYSRHIQEGRGLVPAKDFVLQMPLAG
jgi:hypothetical protein